MQLLQQAKLQYNDSLSPLLLDSWKKFAAELNLEFKINLPLYLLYLDNYHVQLLGFSDVSEKRYNAAIHLKIKNPNDSSSIHFITAKSKVAYLKTGNSNMTKMVPSLELYGALI